MTFISSNISITNRIEQCSLYFYNGGLSARVRPLKSVLQPIEQQIFARIVGLIISPAALLEMIVHIMILPFSVIYAIGKSIYTSRCDFILPQQHIQRIRDAVFPILFGSLFGWIHPYLGMYAAEPTKKHIATSILLSGTEVEFDTVCSPLTTMHEISSLLSKTSDSLTLSKEEKKLLNQVIFWEEELEKIQSIDFFSLNFAFKMGNKIQQTINRTSLPTAFKEIAKRISAITYPIFVILDLIVFIFTAAVSLSMLVVKMIGGQSPAYLEKAWSPEVQIYNIVKIPLFIISCTIGFLISIVHPKTGLSCAKYALDWMAKIPFYLKMLGLKHRLRTMNVGEFILIPAVHAFSDVQNNSLLPSQVSHMRYLLIEKTDAKHYRAELIERGSRHKKTKHLLVKEMEKIMQNALALRYKFGNNEDALNAFNQDDSMINLGQQPGINNCIVTNLFAAIEVLRHKFEKNNFDNLCKEVKTQALRRYYMYASDFYPFGGTQAILREIDNIFHKKI